MQLYLSAAYFFQKEVKTNLVEMTADLSAKPWKNIFLEPQLCVISDIHMSNRKDNYSGEGRQSYKVGMWFL